VPAENLALIPLPGRSARRPALTQRGFVWRTHHFAATAPKQATPTLAEPNEKPALGGAFVRWAVLGSNQCGGWRYLRCEMRVRSVALAACLPLLNAAQ
jgi:hypothetical protein